MFNTIKPPVSDFPSICIECKKEICAGARLCEHCTSYQSHWKNNLKYVGGVVGVIAAIATAAVYMVGALPEIRKAYSWRDHIEVLQFSTNRGLTLLNDGDGTVYVSHVDIVAYKTDGTPFYRRTFPVSMAVDKFRTLERLPESDSDPRMKSQRFQVVATADQKEWEALMTEATDIDAVLAGEACVLRAIYFEQEPRLQNYRESLKDRFKTYKAKPESTFTLYNRERRAQSRCL